MTFELTGVSVLIANILTQTGCPPTTTWSMPFCGPAFTGQGRDVSASCLLMERKLAPEALLS